jgi:hypothetical protein
VVVPLPMPGIKCSDVVYPFARGTVFSALQEVLPQTRLGVLAIDRERWVIVGETAWNLVSFGEIVTISLWRRARTKTAVVVESRSKHELHLLTFGANWRNVRMVFKALDRRLYGEDTAIAPAAAGADPSDVPALSQQRPD